MQTDRGLAQASQRGVIASFVGANLVGAILVGAILVGAILYGATGVAAAEGPLKLAGSQLEPVKWSELAGWTADDHLAAFAAYQASCRALRKIRRTDDRGQIFGALSNVCRTAIGLQPQDADAARAFFEQNFQPVRIARLGEAEGLLTGYFEPVVAGSRFPSPEFSVPVYRRPRDLVAAGYQPGATAFPNKGVRISRRDGKNQLVPYYDRGAIEAGALDGQKLEICWLKDPLDLTAIQIEGSGRVILEDGTPLRITYDSHNGYPYSSIERVLIERKFISRKEMSPQRIRRWMAAHPDEAAKVRATNRAYTFFRVTGLSNDGEPVGAEGVPLTPGRSIAVDRLHEYGTPFFIEANFSVDSVKPALPFRRLMIAQDTGSAIVGPARADLYWGAGDDAGRIAGRIHHPGRFVMLLPRELDMVAAGKDMPLPAPKPKFAETEVAKRDRNGKAHPALAAANPVPSPALKAKVADVPLTSLPRISASTRVFPRAMRGRVREGAQATAGEELHGGNGKVESAVARSVTDGRHIPAAAPKAKTAELEAGTRDAQATPKGRQRGQRDKAKSAGSAEIAAGAQRPVPVPKPKIRAIEVGSLTARHFRNEGRSRQ